MTSPIHLIYQAYGGQTFWDQTLYSILSFYHQCAAPDDVRVVVYTDNPTYFTDANPSIICEKLTPERIKAWSGHYHFVHRLKIEMIRDAMQRYGSPLLYLDGDTIWVKPPNPLFQALNAGRYVMHTREGTMSPQFFPDLYACLQREREFIIRKTGLNIPSRPEVWNAGVIGLPGTQIELLDQVLQLCDALFVRCYQREWLEQVAFSILLQQEASLTEAEQEIVHYWGYSSEAIGIVQDLLQSRTSGNPFPFIEPAELERQSHIIQKLPENRRRQRLKRLRRSYRKRLTHYRVLFDQLLHRPH